MSRYVDYTREVEELISSILNEKFSEYNFSTNRRFFPGGGMIEIHIDAPMDIITKIKDIVNRFQYGVMDDYGNYVYCYDKKDGSPLVKYIFVTK